ncbi:MAG: SdpI family protein [Deltaproteobacteria bacterium]|nr:SdpI family protein [Deltaproteobacteria bacterium]
MNLSPNLGLLNLLFAASFVFAGLLVVAVSIPLFLGKVPRNRHYGVRIRKAFVSDANWYAINRHGSVLLMIFGGAVAAAGMASLFVSLEPPGWPLVMLILAPLILIGPVVVGIYRFARKLPDS